MSSSLLRRLGHRLRGVVARTTGRAGRPVAVRLLGRQLLLQPGSFRKQPDYDDAWVLACARRARRVLDVGANRGYDAVVMLVGSSIERIVLIDASPEALGIAAGNLIRNGLGPTAQFVPAFAGAADGETVTFWTSRGGAAGSLYADHARTAAARGESIEVPTTTLGSVCDRLEIAPDFVKIDVEGAEAEVLEGASALAARAEARFLVEMHSNPSLTMVDNVERVLGWCRRVDYRAWYLKAGQELSSAGPIAHRGRCHLLLQPAAWPYPEWLAALPQGAPLAAAAEPGESL